MDKHEKITKRIYLKQHSKYFSGNAYKRMLDVYKNPSTYGLTKKDFLNKKVLDLGCGSTGYLQKAMEILKCHSVTCSDLGKKYIIDLKKFEKREIKKNNFLVYKTQNIKKLTFENNSFDIVFLNGVIMHLKNLGDVKKALREAQRVVKKSGYIWIYAGFEDRNGIVDNYLIEGLRKAYSENNLFKKLIDNLDVSTLEDLLNLYKNKFDSKDFSILNKFIKKYITIETLVFFQNVLQVPHQIGLQISYSFIENTLNKCRVKKTPPLKFKRTDIRKFLQPFHSSNDKLSKTFYNKHLHVLAKKL